MRQTIKQPTLFLRSAYFIDNLKEITAEGFAKLEKRIRENQYEAFKLRPPATETVRDYFRLHLPVAFEPTQKVACTPWLLAAELEVQGSSTAFFHPIFDLLFGRMESAAFWDMHFGLIPEIWIEQAEARGDVDIAAEWKKMNEYSKNRKHRKRQEEQIDPLSFIHLTLMRLPSPLLEILFERKGLSPSWTRKYASAELEVTQIQSVKSIDSLTALLGLTKEAAEIGDMTRFHQAQEALLGHLSVLDERKAYQRINQKLKNHLIFDCKNMIIRRYHRSLYFGFGLPASWRANSIGQRIDQEEKEIMANLLPEQ